MFKSKFYWRLNKTSAVLRKLRRLCPSNHESDRAECLRLCSTAEGRNQEICRTVLETTTDSSLVTLTSPVSAPDCGEPDTTWNSSLVGSCGEVMEPVVEEEESSHASRKIITTSLIIVVAIFWLSMFNIFNF